MSRVAAMTGGSLVRSGLLACLVALGALIAPASALATVPTVVTQSVFATTPNSEVIQGTVDPHGLSTTYWVKYAAASTTFCGGSTNTTPTTLSSATLTYSDDNPHAVTVDINGLTSGGAYCAEIFAHNSSNSTGQSTGGGIVDFTASIPSTATMTATATGVQQATLVGTVDPASQQTSYFVMYDTAGSAWCGSGGESGTPDETTPVQLGPQDGAFHQVTASITLQNLQNGSVALAPDSSYCAAIAATNHWGTSAVIDAPQGFTTETPVTSTSVESTGATTAQLTGSVNPDGQSTTYYAAYALVGSPWCQSDEASGSPSTSTPVTLAAEDQNPHNVTVNVTGLLRGATYCFSLQSSNASLPTSDGGQLSPPLTVGLPVVTLSTGPTPDSLTSAQVTGTISATGQPTSYEVQYDLQSSPWCVNGGTQGSATYSTAAQSLPADEQDDNNYNVTVEMPNLPPGTPYCALLAAFNGSNGQNGSPQFTDSLMEDFTSGLAPALGVLTAQQLTPSTSALTATVNPEDQATTYQVEYDFATSPWCNGSGTPTYTTSNTSVGATDANDHTETVDLTNLTAGATYCAALVASNGSGPTTGTQMQFIAGQPTAVATSAALASPTSETLTGTVTPAGQSTDYYVAWDTESSLWCEGGGGDPAAATNHTAVAGAVGGVNDDSTYPVSPVISGLAPGEQYCAEIVAANADGSALNWSSLQPFTAGYPFTVATSDALGVTDTTATVDGIVNPAGLNTTYSVAYDVQGSDWCSSGGSSDDPGMSTTPASLPADTVDHSVSVSLSGLQPGTGYCAAIVAQNDTGTLDGAQVSFTTGGTAGVTGTAGTGSGGGSGTGGGGGSGTTSPGRNAPSHMAIRAASATSPSGALVTASINPDGERTIYDAAFAPASSRFCVSNGQKGIASRTSFQAMRQTDFSAHTVTAPIAGLYSGSRYCAEIIAQNASGQTASVIAVFTTIGHPRLADLRLGSSVLRPGSHGHAIRILYRESQAGTVTFTVARRAARCTNRSHICAGPVVGRFTRHAHAGRDSFTFAGRLGDKSLTRGGYVLEAVIRNRWQLSSGRMTVAFSVR